MENIRKLIIYKVDCLNRYQPTLENLFNIIHDQPEGKLFSEEYNGYLVKQLTYQEQKTNCLKMGTYLKNLLSDIPKNSYIGLLGENSPRWLECFWGLLMAGYRPMLLNARLPSKLNLDIITMLDIKMVLTSSVKPWDLAQVNYNDIKLPEEVDQGFNWANEIALSTSATSMDVKVCTYRGEEIFCEVKNTKGILENNRMVKRHYEGYLKLLAFLPFYHIFGLFATYLWFSIFGRCFVFLRDYGEETILKTIRRTKVTHVFAVPMLWHKIYAGVLKEVNRRDEKTKKKFYKGLKLSTKLQTAFPKLGLKIAKKMFREVREKLLGESIQFMISGGSYIQPDAIKMLNAIGYPLYNGYGMTEIGITSVELRENIKYRNLSSVGKPLDSVTYKIEDGILKVKGKSLCHQVITKSGTLELNHDVYFDTTDMATIDKKGSFYLLGRADDVAILSGGEKINPDLVEKELYLPFAKNFTIMALEENGHNQLALIMQIDHIKNQIERDYILQMVDVNLERLHKSGYQIERIYFTTDMIANPNAIKVSRKYVKSLLDSGNLKLISYQDFKTEDINFEIANEEVTKQVMAIMANILDCDVAKIKPTDHFILDLGASSLDYITLLVDLKNQFDVDFNFVDEKTSAYSALQFCDYIIRKEKNKVNEIQNIKF